MEINVDCLDRSNIDKITCDFAGISHEISCSEVMENIQVAKDPISSSTENKNLCVESLNTLECSTSQKLHLVQEYLASMSSSFSRPTENVINRDEDNDSPYCNNGLKSKGYFLCFI